MNHIHASMVGALLTFATIATASAQTLVDTFTDGIRDRVSPAEDVSASQSNFTLTGEESGVPFYFHYVASKTYDLGDGQYEYCYKMDYGMKPAIYNKARQADGLVINQVSATLRKGQLRIFGCPNSSSTTFCYSGYAENPVGDFLGTISAASPTLNVYGEYGAIIVEPVINDPNSAIFQSISFTWGTPKEDPGTDPDQPATLYTLSNMTYLGGPYNSANSDALLRLSFDLTYNGTETDKTMTMNFDVLQGVDHHNFNSKEVTFPGQGPVTMTVGYGARLTGTIPCELGRDAVLTVTGGGETLYQGAITVCNYSPKFTMTSALSGAADVAPVAQGSEFVVPFQLTCDAGPYRGTLECEIFNTPDCKYADLLGTVDILDQLANGESKDLEFSFTDITLEPNHQYGYRLRRTKANGNYVTVGENLTFTTGEAQPAQTEAFVVNDLTVNGEIFSCNYVPKGETYMKFYPLDVTFSVTSRDADASDYFSPMLTVEDGRNFEYMPMELTFANAMETREVEYKDDAVSEFTYAGPAKLTVGYYDETFTFVPLCPAQDVEVISGRPAFTLEPTIQGGSQAVDPSAFTIDLRVTCDLANGPDPYDGKIQVYVYDNPECTGSLTKLPVFLKTDRGQTSTITFPNMKIPAPEAGHEYYYTFWFLNINNKYIRIPGTWSFTAAGDSGVDAIGVDGADSADAVYYNLQGIRVDAPSAGQIVIRRQGNTTAKVRF